MRDREVRDESTTRPALGEKQKKEQPAVRTRSLSTIAPISRPLTLYFQCVADIGSSRDDSTSNRIEKGRPTAGRMSDEKESTAAESNKRKRDETEAARDNPNKDICDLLLELADHEKNADKERFKSIAYRKAAQILAEQKHRVKSGKEAQELPGIGEGIAAQIDEFLARGKTEKQEEAEHDDDAQEVGELSRVPGIGIARARELKKQGIHTIEDLKKHSDKLTESQQIALRYLDDIEKPISRARAKKVSVSGPIQSTAPEISE